MAEQEKKDGKPAAGKGTVSDDDLEKVSGGASPPDTDPNSPGYGPNIEVPPGGGPRPA